MENISIERPNNLPQKHKKMKRIFRYYFLVGLVVLVIILLALTFYFYKKSKTSNPDLSQVEVQSLVDKVSRLALVPTDEMPTIATVSDPDALKNQPFFVGAKKGDKVLIYSNAKKAYLYDPVSDKIINIAPLNLEPQEANK
ncbi:hypothetical protein IT402_01815 [Candidatus Nomurabacteria bacterium]|nr:hypothetical protein [Candidatus Nomurabacteria bacterium]